MSKLSVQELLERAQVLAELGGIDLPLEEIMLGLATAEEMHDKGVPPVRHGARTKSKSHEKDIEEILGKELGRLAREGVTILEDGTILVQSPEEKKGMVTASRSALNQKRAAATAEWKATLEQRRADPYFDSKGGTREMATAVRKGALRKMTPAQRRSELEATIVAAREKAYEGFVSQ